MVVGSGQSDQCAQLSVAATFSSGLCRLSKLYGLQAKSSKFLPYNSINFGQKATTISRPIVEPVQIFELLEPVPIFV